MNARRFTTATTPHPQTASCHIYNANPTHLQTLPHRSIPFISRSAISANEWCSSNLLIANNFMISPIRSHQKARTTNPIHASTSIQSAIFYNRFDGDEERRPEYIQHSERCELRSGLRVASISVKNISIYKLYILYVKMRNGDYSPRDNLMPWYAHQPTKPDGAKVE